MEKYELLNKEIGHGNFGTAELVKSKETKAILVLKKIILEKLPGEKRKYADNEVRSMEILKHPFIVRLYDTFLLKGYLCLVIEYCQNGSMHDRLNARKHSNEGPFSEFQTLKWGGQLLSAVAYAHDKRVMHRDIKPDNIFLTASDDAKLGDFGVTRLDAENAETFAGTPTHMAPEMMTKNVYSNKVDEWASGVVIFQLATLRLPFEGKAYNDFMTLITKCKFTYPISNIKSQLVRDIVERLLEPDENKRARAIDILGSVLQFKYEILSPPIGRGSFGIVSKAINRLTKEAVAVKIIDLNSTKINSDDLNRAKDEVEALKKFDHQSIVRFRDCFELPGEYCIVLEFCSGGTLDERISTKRKTKESPFSEQTVVRWGTEMLSAVSYIHLRKVIHRDIKPKNIFLTEDGSIKLGDFGAVKIMQSSDNAETAIGTLNYMAPEVICKKEGYNQLVDEWSSGVVLFEISTLKLPFKAATYFDVINKVSKGEFQNDISIIQYPGVREAVRNLLQANSSERATAEVALKMLQGKATKSEPKRLPTAIALKTKSLDESYVDPFQEPIKGVFGQATRVRDRNDNVFKLVKLRTAAELTSKGPENEEALINANDALLKIKQSEFTANMNKIIEHFSTHDGNYAVVYEYQRGGSVAKAMVSGKLNDFSQPKLWAFTAQIAGAIQFLHQREIVHRDIISRNVFIRGETFKLGDLGVAKEQMGFIALKELGIAYISHLAPEIVSGKTDKWDKATDMWSFGCLLHELAALKHPFAAANVPETMSNIAGNIRMSSIPNDRAPNSFKTMVDSLLVIDPRHRANIQSIIKLREVASA